MKGTPPVSNSSEAFSGYMPENSSRSRVRGLFPGDQRVPDRQEGLVVVVERLLAQGRDLVGVPVALEVLARLPDRGLAEVERVLDVPGQRPALGAEGHRARGGGLPDLEPALGPERVDMPLDVDDLESAGRGRRLLPGALRRLLGAHAASLPAATNTAAESPRWALTRPPLRGSRPGPPRSSPPPRWSRRPGSRSCRGACSRGGADEPRRRRRSPSRARAPAGSCPRPSAGWLACTRRHWRSASQCLRVH